jgi:hypothetical protein
VAKLQNSKSLFPEETQFWDQIFCSIDEAKKTAGGIEFQPPSDPNWWSSVAGKEANLTGIEEAAKTELTQAMSGSSLIRELSKKVRTNLEQQQKLHYDVQEKLKEIKEDFDNQLARLTDLSKPFGALSLDLNTVIPNFPVLLGIILAAVSIWPAYHLKELAWIINLMAKEGGEKFSHRWLLLQIQYACPKLRGTSSKGCSWNLDFLGKFGGTFRSVIYCIWICIAAWQLIGWKGVDVTRSVIFACTGCMTIAVAQTYKSYIMRWALSLSDSMQ